MKLNTILDQIDMGSVALPKFQRGYVWRRRQVRKLMRSLYLGYPVGSLLMWETQTEKAEAKGDAQLASGKGYRCFTSLEQFQRYVEKETLDRPA